MKKNSKKTKVVCKIAKIILAIILVVAVYINSYLIFKYNVLPIKYLIIYIILVIVIPLILIIYSLFKRPRKKVKIGITIAEIIYVILLVVIFFYLNQTFDFLANLTKNNGYETKKYYVLTSSNSKYEHISDLDGKTIGYAKGIDSSMDLAMETLNKRVKLNFQNEEGYEHLFENVRNNTFDCILIVDSIYEILKEAEENNITIGTKVIYEFTIKEKMADIGKDVDVTKEPFNIYLSGIDSYDSVTDKARSDVNMVISVNPTTHKVLLINIPRDFYVTLDGIGEKDKLTHAGLYGIEVSVNTIEKLLGIEFNYYVKVNYNALIDLVDALDGVEVYSEYDFYSTGYNYKFVKGYNKVDGKMALDFVQTRKAFIQGDRVRGENQQRMIQAIVNRVISPAILVKYGDMLEALEGTFITNVNTNTITSVVNMQLDKMPKWEFETFSLNGSDSKEFTYSVPNTALYVMIPNEKTIEEARQKINAIFAG